MESTAMVLVFAVLGGLASLSLAIVMMAKEDVAIKIAEYATPFAAGALLASAFFELIPEGAEISSVETIMFWSLLGFLAFFVLESTLGWFHHHHEHDHQDKKTSTIPLIIVGDTLHNFIDGAAIAAGFLISTQAGIITTIAVALHEIPQEIGDFGLLIKRGMKPRKVIRVNILSATSTVVGAWLFFTIGSSAGISITWLMGLTAGFFIYIAASDIIPDIHRSEGRRKLIIQSVLVLVGLLAVWGALSMSHQLSDDELHNDHQVAVKSI